MLDFLMISTRSPKRGIIEIYPHFKSYIANGGKSTDLMTKDGDFYAIWNENAKLWSTEEDVALYLIDKELDVYYNEHKFDFSDTVKVLHMWDSDSGMIDKWHKYCQKQLRNNYHTLDEKVIFANTETVKEDYATKKLPYSMSDGAAPAYDELIGTLYDEKERKKIEWAIGAIISGDSVNIQKFMVMYGAPGSGKSTILNIIQELFQGYYSIVDVKALGSNSNNFALESFRSNPLVAIQHDGDLARIEDNTRLNSLVSHETMSVNLKNAHVYSDRFKCFLFVGTNKPVKITDAKSGVIRRLIDVSPSGNRIPLKKYQDLVNRANFELGAISKHCLQVYLENKDIYDNYVPLTMLGATNDFYDFVLDCYEIFKEHDSVSLTDAWELYQNYCKEAKVLYPMSRRPFQEELKNYFKDFKERGYDEKGKRVRSYYSGFLSKKFEVVPDDFMNEPVADIPEKFWLEFNCTESKLDKMLEDCPAQYATEDEKPITKWDAVKTKLKDILTSLLHYVLVPLHHIVIDFDLKDENGNKSFEKNLEAASKWPPTYAELSKSGQGIHLHYIYEGDPTKLSRLYAENIEIKVFTGKSSLRRKLTRCNDLDIAVITSGLPMKGDGKTINHDAVRSERSLRSLISRNLRKEFHPGTKPSIDFIYKILDDAYKSDLHYDVSDMRPDILRFAQNSSHQAEYCVALVSQMKFKSEEVSAGDKYSDNEDSLTFYDLEVYPNLFVAAWASEEGPPMAIRNPTPTDIEALMKEKLVGFNCRRYDNHIMYARSMGFDNYKLYQQSQRIINGSNNAFFGEAYNISYTDIYDFSSDKKSLKKFEIEMAQERAIIIRKAKRMLSEGISIDDISKELKLDKVIIQGYLDGTIKAVPHKEMGIPWDQPVPEDKVEEVMEYCMNDVLATRELFKARHGDWLARQILADVAEMTVNDTTNSLTTRIIFGKERHPELVYTDLSEEFPGYAYISALESEDNKQHNMYRGVDLGFGGYVYANPGMYGRTVTFDVASMHPSSIIQLNCFGEYTAKFKELLDARIAIKHKDFETAKKMLGGKLAKYLTNEEDAKALSNALKIAINSVYGLTSASFDNPFRDPRNKNNIVALRGALFMKTLQDEVEARGFKVAHIKTDSIKVVDPDDDISNFIIEFGKKYGYNFEIEHIFEKICLVNDAVYIAKCAADDPDDPGQWTATGTQFQVPYVFKSLFSHESIEFEDLCETKSVTSSIYIDMNEDLPEGEHNYIFVGKVGLFCPIKPGCRGGELFREKDGKYYALAGTKGWRWMEADMVEEFGKQDDIDVSYYTHLVDEAVSAISEFGDFEWFAS